MSSPPLPRGRRGFAGARSRDRHGGNGRAGAGTVPGGGAHRCRRQRADAAVARDRLRGSSSEVDLRVARLQDPLPDGPFDLVVSALCVHHLDREEKRDLFRRLAGVLAGPGRLVLADVVVPVDPVGCRDRADPWLRQAELGRRPARVAGGGRVQLPRELGGGRPGGDRGRASRLSVTARDNRVTDGADLAWGSLSACAAARLGRMASPYRPTTGSNRQTSVARSHAGISSRIYRSEMHPLPVPRAVWGPEPVLRDRRREIVRESHMSRRGDQSSAAR